MWTIAKIFISERSLFKIFPKKIGKKPVCLKIGIQEMRTFSATKKKKIEKKSVCLH